MGRSLLAATFNRRSLACTTRMFEIPSGSEDDGLESPSYSDPGSLPAQSIAGLTSSHPRGCPTIHLLNSNDKGHSPLSSSPTSWQVPRNQSFLCPTEEAESYRSTGRCQQHPKEFPGRTSASGTPPQPIKEVVLTTRASDLFCRSSITAAIAVEVGHPSRSLCDGCQWFVKIIRRESRIMLSGKCWRTPGQAFCRMPAAHSTFSVFKILYPSCSLELSRST